MRSDEIYCHTETSSHLARIQKHLFKKFSNSSQILKFLSCELCIILSPFLTPLFPCRNLFFSALYAACLSVSSHPPFPRTNTELVLTHWSLFASLIPLHLCPRFLSLSLSSLYIFSPSLSLSLRPVLVPCMPEWSRHVTSTLWLLNRAVAGGIAGPSRSPPSLSLFPLSLSLLHLLLISLFAFIHFCVWARRANMDSLGLFILLMLLCFQWTTAPAAGKVLIN